MITKIHKEVLNFLLKYKKETDKNLFFVPRRINNKGRLDKGYFFTGGENYLGVSFWEGGDSKEKIHNIAVIIIENGESYIELSSRDDENKANHLKLLSKKLHNTDLRFEEKNSNYKCRFYMKGTKYLDNLKRFIENEKKVIDDYLKSNKVEGIKFLDSSFHQKYVVEKILNGRDFID